MFLPYILFASLLIVVAAILASMVYKSRSASTSKKVLLAQVKERARQRKLDRDFMDTEPKEDPYNRAYDLKNSTYVVEVDESANGYGILDDEQKRVIAAIFDGQPQVSASINIRTMHGSRCNQSVFGDSNRVDPIPERDIWSTSRN